MRSVNGRANYESGHIPSAGFADLMGDLADGESDLNFAMPTPEAFADAMGALGVSDDSRVVLYDAMGSVWAARVWWMLRWIGFDQAALLDGGLAAWTAQGLPLSTLLAPEARPALTEVATRRGARVKVVEIPPGPPVIRLDRWVPELDGEVVVHMQDRVQLPRSYFVWHSPPWFADDDAEMDVFGQILGGDFLVDPRTVFSMYFGEDGQVIFLRHAPQPSQIIPGAGPVEEVGLTGLLVQVGECIEADNPCTVFAEFAQCLVVKGPDQFGTRVEIHLAQVLTLAADRPYDVVFRVIDVLQVCCFQESLVLDDDLDMVCKRLRLIRIESFYVREVTGRYLVEVHLLIEGIPVLPEGAIRKADPQYR